jgi:hypothetical protein
MRPVLPWLSAGTTKFTVRPMLTASSRLPVGCVVTGGVTAGLVPWF